MKQDQGALTTLAEEAAKGLLIEAIQTKDIEQKQRLLYKIAEVFEFDLSAIVEDK
jgi:hypothetical protein